MRQRGKQRKAGPAARCDPVGRVSRKQPTSTLTSPKRSPTLYLRAPLSLPSLAPPEWDPPAEERTKGGVQPRSPVSASVTPLAEQQWPAEKREEAAFGLPPRPGQEGGVGPPELSIPQRVGTKEAAPLTVPPAPQNKCRPWPPACVLP